MDFTAFDLRVGTVAEAALEDGALRLVIDFGGVRREAEARITENYGPDDLVGEQVVAVTNPGGRGRAVVLAAVSPSAGAVLLRPERPVADGTQVV
jgi:tRNA-binding protein